MARCHDVTAITFWWIVGARSGSRRLNSANPPSLFGQGIVARNGGDDAAYGATVTIRILNDLMLFSCLVALATRVL